MDPQDPGPGPYSPPPQPAPGGGAPVPVKSAIPDSEARTMAMLAHLLGALLGFLGPLIIWLVKREDHPFIDDQAKEALNFHITLIFAYLVAGILTGISCGLLFFVCFVPWVLQIVFGIIGAVQSNKGDYYRYPLTIRLIQ